MLQGRIYFSEEMESQEDELTPEVHPFPEHFKKFSPFPRPSSRPPFLKLCGVPKVSAQFNNFKP